jgi:hypothetical protein
VAPSDEDWQRIREEEVFREEICRTLPTSPSPFGSLYSPAFLDMAGRRQDHKTSERQRHHLKIEIVGRLDDLGNHIYEDGTHVAYPSLFGASETPAQNTLVGDMLTYLEDSPQAAPGRVIILTSTSTA